MAKPAKTLDMSTNIGGNGDQFCYINVYFAVHRQSGREIYFVAGEAAACCRHSLRHSLSTNRLKKLQRRI
jgi:hypothetical protein